MPRLGGEYYDPNDDGALPVQHARLVFLASIERAAPDVLVSLRDDVLPAFHALAPHYMNWATLRAVASRLRTLPAERLPEALALNGMAQSPVPLADALEAWGERWHLTDQWVMDDALWTLRTWTDAPQALKYTPLHFHPDGWGGSIHELNIEPCRPFEPQSETWREFASRVEAWTERNRRAAEALAAEHGLASSPDLRPRGDAAAGRQFEWLALWQCQEWSAAKIVVEYDIGGEDGGDLTTPGKAVRKAAKLIGLTLRK